MSPSLRSSCWHCWVQRVRIDAFHLLSFDHSLSNAFSSGDFDREPAPANSREDPAKFTEAMWRVLEGLGKLCEKKDCTMTAFANAWCAAQPGITSPIIGPNSVEQLDENLAASEVKITEEDTKRVDELVKPGEHVEGQSYYNADFVPVHIGE